MNRIRRLAALATLALAAPAWAQHSGDIWIGVVDGAVQTGGVQPDQSIDAPLRVFLAEFGDAGFPEFTSNPGFNSLDTGLALGSQFGLDVPAALRVWDGAAFTDAGGAAIEVSFAIFSTSTADAPADGFALNAPDGELHIHYTFELMGPAANDPVPGVYLLELVFFTTDPSADDSEPFWIVFDYQAEDPADVDAAAAWVVDNLVGGGAGCAPDLDGDDTVGFGDLTKLLNVWGACSACPEDLDQDDTVGFGDLTTLLNAWGACS